MSCAKWNEQWIAHLYGELEAEEATHLEGHLAGCADCRRRMELLAESSRLLREAAPVVPAVPRWAAIESRRGWQPAWAFVSGLACASVLFSLGLFAAPRLGWIPVHTPSTPSDAVDTASIRENLEQQAAQQARLSERVEAFETRLAARQPSAATGVSRRELDRRLDSLTESFETQRAADVRYLLGEITATEVRAGTWVDETRNALRFVALNNDPRFTER